MRALIAMTMDEDECDFARMRLIVDYDLLRHVDRTTLLRMLVLGVRPGDFTRVHYARIARWLFQYDEESMRAICAPDTRLTAKSYMRLLLYHNDDTPLNDARGRLRGFEAACVLLCAGGGAWTFAFYKIQQFLY